MLWTMKSRANSEEVHMREYVDGILIRVQKETDIFGDGVAQNLTALREISGNTSFLATALMTLSWRVTTSIITRFSSVPALATMSRHSSSKATRSTLATATVTLCQGPSGAFDSSDIIKFGNGDGDRVTMAAGWLDDSSITFGNGNGDYLSHPEELRRDVITFGNGAGDSLNANNIRWDKIILGNGKGDSVSVDGVAVENTIILGNGDGDSVVIHRTLHAFKGNYIATGTGVGDTVTDKGTGGVTSDTFAFALGTSGKNFTTVNGAMVGDHVVVNGGVLGGTLISKGFSSGETLTSFITSIGSPTRDHTYIGNNGTDTFIFTDTYRGQTGAIEIVGVFTGSSIHDHVLTLA